MRRLLLGSRFPTDDYEITMSTPPNIRFFLDLLKVIEEEFGPKWLEKKARAAQSRPTTHPIPSAFARITTVLDEDSLEPLGVDSEMAEILELGLTLRTTRNLPGYVDNVRAKLKGIEWEKAFYVAQVAALFVASEYEVEFLNVSQDKGVRTPDLRAAKGSRLLEIECKRRESYLDVSPHSDVWDRLGRAIVGLQPVATSDFEVIVCTLGPLRPELAERVLEATREAITHQRQADVLIAPDCAVLVRINPSVRPAGGRVPISGWQPITNLGSRFRIKQDDSIEWDYTVRSTLYMINAHRFEQVVRSFNEARHQLRPDGAGVIFIGADTSRIAIPDRMIQERMHDVYFTMVKLHLERLFKAHENTRVAAVGVSGSIYWVDLLPGETMIMPRRGATVVLNPHARIRIEPPFP